MTKKKKNNNFGLVYSTDEDLEFQQENEEIEELEPGRQRIRIWLDSKQRKGKAATLIKGYIASAKTLEEIAKELKVKLGTGGNVIDDDILIQGDKRQEVLTYFQQKGVSNVKLAGGR